MPWCASCHSYVVPTAMTYMVVHDMLGAIAMLAGYHKPQRITKQREVSAKAWHNTFLIETDGPVNMTRTGVVKRLVKLVVLKHVPSMEQVKKSTNWQATLEHEADCLLHWLWWWAWKNRPADLGVGLKEATAIVEPDTDREGNYYRVTLSVAVTYRTTMEQVNEEQHKETGAVNRPGA